MIPKSCRLFGQDHAQTRSARGLAARSTGNVPSPVSGAEKTQACKTRAAEFELQNTSWRKRYMMNRRNFLLATAAGAATLSGIPGARAATYDLVIKGGHVIDPSLRINEVRAVAFAGTKIAAVEANITADAA